jgi:alpha-L-fucosidase 2
MLLQSHANEISLLPALPAAWPSGSVRGLRARGGFGVDITWKEGRLAGATVRAARDGAFALRVPRGQAVVEVLDGETPVPGEPDPGDPSAVRYPAQAGKNYTIRF